MMRKLQMTFSGDFIYRRHVSQTIHDERRIISYSTEINRRYLKYPYILRCDVGETY